MKDILGIFQLEDTAGVIDEYIFYLMDFLKYHVDRFIFCYTVRPEEKGWKRLSGYTAEIYESHEFYSHEGKSILQEYHRVLLMDDGFFGPIYKVDDLPKRIEDAEFLDFADSHMLIFNQKELILIVAETLESLAKNPKNIVPRLAADIVQVKLVRKTDIDVFCEQYRMPPFISKRSLLAMNLDKSSAEYPRECLDFIEEKTVYDTKLIWNHLLRTCNITDLKNAFHLEYIFAHKHFSGNKEYIQKKQIAVIAHLYYDDLIDECIGYLNNVPEFIDLYITVTDENTKNRIEENLAAAGRKNYQILLKENRGRDVSALLVACHDILMRYEYLCFVHDKKSANYLKYRSEGESFQHNVWENMLVSQAYIYSVLQCFLDHPCLGFLTPPEPYYGSLLGYLGESWGRCFEGTDAFRRKLGLNCNLDRDKLPITVSTSFWCRTEALRPLFTRQFRYEDFPQEPMEADGTFSHVIEHIFGYVAQHQGYYTAVMLNQDYASLRGNGLQYLLIEALKELRKEADILKPSDIKNRQATAKGLLSFCGQYPFLYIYGAGTYGLRCSTLLEWHGLPFQGYVVTNGKRMTRELHGYPIYELSEVPYDCSRTGIILALNARNGEEVKLELDKAGYKNRYNFLTE